MTDRDEQEWAPDRQRYASALAGLGSESQVDFLDNVVVEAIHDDMVSRFGGLMGIRDPAMLESALSAPMQQEAYAESVDLPSLAATLATRLVKNHAFLDANKRTGFMAMVLFLRRNGLAFSAGNVEVKNVFNDLAAGRITEPDLGDWIGRRVAPLPLVADDTSVSPR